MSTSEAVRMDKETIIGGPGDAFAASSYNVKNSSLVYANMLSNRKVEMVTMVNQPHLWNDFARGGDQLL